MKTYFKFMKREKMLLPLFILIIITSIQTTLDVVATKFFSDGIQKIGTPELKRTIAIFIAISIGALIMMKVRWTFSTYVRENHAEVYRNNLYTKVLKMPVKEMQTFNMAQLTTSIQSSYDVVDDSILVPIDGTIMVLSFVSSVFVMAITDAFLTLIMVCCCAPVIFVFMRLHKNIKSLTEKRRKTSVKMNTMITRLEGFQTIKSFGKENEEIGAFKKVSSKFKEIAIKKKFSSQNTSLLMNGLYYILTIIIVIYIVIVYKNDTVTGIAKAIVFYSLSMNMFSPFASLPSFIDSLTNMIVHMEENEKIMNATEDHDGGIKLEEFTDSIEFKDVSFSYDKSSSTLKNISLKIQKGMKVGIYGPSGGGKSTFINLLNRFFLVDKGTISIDGFNINDLTASSLRKIIGNVNQEIYIFSDMTVRENIKYGLQNVTDSQIEEAAKLANAHEFITKLPNGYDSIVGNNGVMLSGGQRQRIAIARLFLLNPPILVLDEATSKLDNTSEKLIKEAIDRLSKDKTIISIAHRFSTIEDSDLLIGIKNNTIFEQGTCDYIKRNGSLYKSLNE